MKHPKLTFSINKEEDLLNVWQTCTQNSRQGRFSQWMPKEVVRLCKGKTFKQAKPKITKYYKDIHDSELIEIYLQVVEKAWKTIEKQYFARIIKTTGKPFKAQQYYAHSTVASRCPYSYNKKENGENSYFFTCFFDSISGALGTITHELIHFHFLDHYYKKVRLKLNAQKTDDLKEALTVLLNFGIANLYFSPDEGYPQHQQLRKFIIKQWKKKQDFDKLIDACIKHLGDKT